MTSHACRFCRGVMDPRDGHRECPSCLGMAHVLEDVANPCAAAVELPRDERACRARQLERSARVGAVQPDPSQFSEEVQAPKIRSRKRKHERTPTQKRRHGSGEKQAVQPSDDPVGAPGGQDGQGDAQLQILAAIRGLSERLGRVEAQWPAMTGTPGEGRLREPSPDELPSGQGDGGDIPDVISLYARGSLFGSGEQSDTAGSDEQLRSSAVEGMSNLSPAGGGESSAFDIISKIMSAAKIVGLNIPVVAPAPMDGVWAGISQTQQPTSVPVAADYLQMLRKSWNAPSGAPQFNAGCRRLTKVPYAPDTGMGDMPPVEREMAALTPLGPERVTANPRCPVKECEKTDRLVCRSYNAATRAARSGNALAILLAALRRTANPEDQDTMSLIDSALVTHSQLTRDVGVVMSSAMMSRRQIWLAQTSLPENIRKELTHMPIVPARVFHPDSQGVLDKAEQSRRTRDCVRRTFSRPTAPSLHTTPLVLARSRGGSMLVSRPLVVHSRHHAVSSSSNPVLPWSVFLTWCRHAQVDPSTCPIELVLRFLQSLLDSGRAASTIKVYTAAISFMRQWFIKGACRLRPTRSPRAPSWDLPLSTFKFLSHKTAFLLAICSAKRVGELHALSVSADCLWWKADDTGVSLWPNPAFLPKVINPQTVNQVIEVGAFRPDPTLCPVRALRAYTARTHSLRCSHSQPFVCFRADKLGLPVTKQCLSRWVATAISEAYSMQSLPVPGNVVAHSTRSVATSWAALRGVPFFQHLRSSLLECPLYLYQVLQGQRGIALSTGLCCALGCWTRRGGVLCSSRHPR
ncbi:hypothetical protein N1851_007723 [Merluccius polli]|uniref:Core-binding (CB) domain-containing protein n=1 Tax=Merluccius polli TaxID=89951 RepID=A0AA47N3R4_MERPO|nr:hypothetical protein N1851_007723 [Merluccius polli]